MEFFETIEKRYSHKERFSPVSVPLEDLELIAKAGLAAPTGNNSQCVRLIILPDKKAIKPLYDASPSDILLSAPAAIALLTDNSVTSGKYNFEIEDYSVSAAQMLLAATALGYVSLWLDSPYFEEEKQKTALAALGAPVLNPGFKARETNASIYENSPLNGYSLRVVLPIGFPENEGKRRNKLTFEERVSYRMFGSGKNSNS
ncbi:MAG: nitroreductase family protein [Treponema sp.]|nr:nitroreductase family protein [Treponema sp.]